MPRWYDEGFTHSGHGASAAWGRRRICATLAGWAALGPAATWSMPQLRMGYFDRYPPLSERTESGRMQGLLIDLVDAVGARAGLRFSHHGFPWARAQAMVQSGELDGLCTNATPARKAYALFCETPLVVVAMGIFFRSDDARPRSLNAVADLRTLRQGSYRGSGFAQQYLEPERIVFDHDAESVLRRIAMGDLDVYVADDLVTRRQIRQLGLAEKLDYRPLNFLPPSMYRWRLRHGFPEAASLVRRMEVATQQAQQEGDLDAILKRHQWRPGVRRRLGPVMNRAWPDRLSSGSEGDS